MDVKRLASFADFGADKLKKHNLFQTSGFVLDIYCLKAGQAQKPHVHLGTDKVYLVFEGRCRFSIGGEVAVHGPGTVVLARAGDEHGVDNPGPDDARLFVVMSPPPVE